MPPNPLANAWFHHALHGAKRHANTPTFPEKFWTPTRNEILDTPLFLANKVRSMTYDRVMKLCMDFYDEEFVIAAKTVLLDHVTVPDTDDKKRKIIGSNKKTNFMKDILNIFLKLTVEKVLCLLPITWTNSHLYL